MNPSNPKYTLQEVGLIKVEPIKQSWFTALVVPQMEEIANIYDNYRQHILFSLLNPEE